VPIELAERFFSPSEAATLRGLSIDLQPERFLQYWTLKEAYVKARGMGLSLALDRFSFDLDEVGDIRASFGPELCDSPGCWHFWLLQPAPGYLAAVCAQRVGHCAQRLVTRKIVPLSFDEPLNCTLLRQSA
jgi:4'-phosphopantetheinyl transferase